MKNSKMGLVAGMLMATVVSAFAVGGVLPDGQGTNWSYGDLYGQGSYYLRNWKTANVDGAGVTNVAWTNLVGTPTSLAGYGITDAVPSTAEFISTNSTPQSKAGLLTLNGGATVGAQFTLVPSALQTLTNGANVAANAALVAVEGDSGAVTCGMADGAAAGQLLTIRGNNEANKVTLTNAAVVPTFALGTNDLISFMWAGAAWIEQYRRDN
ncbi:MAG: hypothetical protein WC130_04435 [Kiritimatiellia bacterium]